MRFLRFLRPLDGFAILLSLFSLGAFSWYVYGAPRGEGALYIQNEAKVWIYPLNKDREVVVPGPLGNTRVRVDHGAAFVEHSPCRDKICVHMGRISRNGEWVACLPNRVFLRIDSTKEEEVDASTF